MRANGHGTGLVKRGIRDAQLSPCAIAHEIERGRLELAGKLVAFRGSRRADLSTLRPKPHVRDGVYGREIGIDWAHTPYRHAVRRGRGVVLVALEDEQWVLDHG